MALLVILTLAIGLVNAEKLLFEIQKTEVEVTVCPDQNSKCPVTATCCKLLTGQWGCCPFLKASCCEDQVHCCPEGYSCNAQKGHCVQAINNVTIPWAKKEPAPPSPVSDEVDSKARISCPDGTVCLNAGSCCRTYSGSFRCCNYPNNVCCSDGYSCCPRCTICDIVSRKCISTVVTEDWKELTQSIPSIDPMEGISAGEKVPASVVSNSMKDIILESREDVIWCNRTNYCQNSQTCCLQPGYVWGCCPYFRATCCSGSRYCCRAGYRCSYPAGRCY